MRSLRARLVLAALAVVALGLVVADIATYSALRSFLYSRVDAQLAGAARSVEAALFTRPGVLASASLRQLGEVVPGVYVQVRDVHDNVLVTVEGRGRHEAPGGPQLPAVLAGLIADDPGAATDAARVLTVASFRPGGDPYRTRVSLLEGGGSLAVAIPLAPTRATLDRLLAVEAVVSFAVLLLAAVTATWLVRIGLRPLTDIEATASAISAGDFAQRVEHTDGRTEVGRLGRALNVMLGRLDAALTERRESEERARGSEERMRRFVGDASHELRTPVAAVRAYAELYRLGADERPEDLARLLHRIEAEAARMGVLVDDLLLLTRLDEGRPLGRAPVDLGAVAGDAVAAARAVEPTRPITLSVEGSVEVIGDRVRLRQVVDNLLANVRAHTAPDTPASVRVRGDGDHAALEVEDEGPGVAPDAASHVFERFYRVETSRTRDNGGAGLGLSIVAAITHAHGGEVTVDAGENGGARFRVALPRLR